MRVKFLAAVPLVLGMWTMLGAQPGSIGAIAGGNVSLLITNKAVQDELKMSEEQIAKAKEWSRDMRTKAAEIRKDKGVEPGGKSGKGFALPSPEQREKIAASNDEIRKVSYQELGDILQKKQMDRLKQIERQNIGIAAFANDDVALPLKLTEAQKTSIKELVDSLGKTRNQILNNALSGGPDLEKLQAAQKDIRKAEDEQVIKAVDLLADEQKKKWRSLAGEPFDLQKLSPFFPKKKD